VLLGSLFLIVPLDPGHEVLQVGWGELPFEGPGGVIVAVFEGGQPVLYLVEVGEVVGCDDFALHDGEEDLYLVEPGGMDGCVDHDRAGVAGGEAVDGGFAAVGGAVVDDPEHPAGRGVRFLRHDLVGQFGERGDPGGVGAEPDHVRLVDVVGGQVGKRAAALVFVVDAHGPGCARRQGGVAAAARLDAGLLIGGDHVLVAGERDAVPDPRVKVQDPGGLGGEVRVADEQPGPVLPGFDRVGGQDPADGGGGDRIGDAAFGHLGGQIGAAPPRQWHPGLGRQLAGQRFDLGDLDRGECRRASGPGPVGQPRHALPGVAASPQADSVDHHATTAGDLDVGVAAGGVEHDPDADDLLVGGGAGVGQLLEPAPFGGGQADLACAGGGHETGTPRMIFAGDQRRMP
jgi:hypothetical protein